ncbi:alcohol dehydrogenase catalytic domain-containing protein [Sphingomonas sanguinis]|uniref:alcohol dehydrogenase catalytic domain-containing protein n=1 Tax=Sphingomonas sanguinis TaxID=33051 RepID=UPI0009E83110
MKALVYHGPGQKSLDEHADPTILEPGDAIVRVTHTTICGTDLHILKGDVPTCVPGRILGHEGVGIVEHVGAAVTSFKPGDHVLISCITACGRCDYCRRGMYSHCATGGWILGNAIDGTQAERVRIPHADTSLYHVPAGASEEALVMLSDILRAHPLAFLRQDLTRRGIVRCADLAHIKDGRHVEVAGIILVRQKPGSAKGVLFITIEDETGIANGILWPDRFEAQRRTVMSAAMIGMKGRVQREGLVIHVICDWIIDHGPLLAQVGQMDFPHATGRGDGARHAGSPDRGDAGWRPGPRDSYWPPHANGQDPEQVVRIKSRDFH